MKHCTHWIGGRPWDGPDARSVMTAVLKTLPPPALRLHPSLMARLEEVNRFLLRVLEKERNERPRDPVAFFEELQTALFGNAAAAKEALSGARPVAPRVSRRLLLAIGVMLLVVAAFLAGRYLR